MTSTSDTKEAVEVVNGRPLQLVTIKMADNEVRVNDEAMEELTNNLVATGCDKISVVSIMGAYRTGKSFMLDLFLRYLRYTDDKEDSDYPLGHSAALNARRSSSLDDKFKAPGWLVAQGDSLQEGQQATDSHGFHWRPGMDKCTEGIWVWSVPFVRQLNSGEKVALVLMDTQGAWDSKMTKEQSATVFGLTAVLSSKQIYNTSKQIQEDKVENLHFFMEVASAALRVSGDEGAQRGKPFQCLEFLVRDWANFDDDMSVKDCLAQMKEHLNQHMDEHRVRDDSTAVALNKMFESVSCFCLPHPGLRIQKKGWSGRLADIDHDFIRFLDLYVRSVFTDPHLHAKTILGKPLSPQTFGPVVKAFVEAFANAVPAAATFTQAMARSSNLLGKEQAINTYKSDMEAAIGPKTGSGIKPDQLERAAMRARTMALQSFSKQTLFGPDEEREKTKDELVKEIDGLLDYYKEENQHRMEKSLAAFAGVTVLVIVLYLMDKFSDFACDWYSDTCVRFSNVLFSIYFTIIVVIGVNVFLLYRDRGQVAAASALLEMVKASINLGLGYAEKVRENPDKQHLVAVARSFASDCSAGLRPVYHKVIDVIQPSALHHTADLPTLHKEDSGIEMTDVKPSDAEKARRRHKRSE
ncbi:atlastin, putative [Perkinsus marinus ATCC 50983]|uniref:Atlastin, putative n=1 Tax=Perkinsus marinus (strain ATCC 50983 / TXsc) TaxID=423536 RepID=C5KEG7_PERM5|nr:atlastin, putative [Perkinsus marinus ATCC 50983]EER17105.1 atlastin, putative [Perkinsus marinus ATCC 50983]|eukprot:XP_002785309.1 atlastin, putative [Perkinsus marinus ATCC 50983]